MNRNMTKNKEFFSTAEVAKILGISRVAVFNKIKNGQIKAIKIGRAFAVSVDDLPVLTGKVLNETTRKEIKAAVDKTIKEYRQTLELLGRN